MSTDRAPLWLDAQEACTVSVALEAVQGLLAREGDLADAVGLRERRVEQLATIAALRVRVDQLVAEFGPPAPAPE